MRTNTAAVVSIPQSHRKPVERRTGWSGFTEEEQKRPGSALLARLLHEANNRGLQLKEMADELGVTYGYVAQLRSGIRQVRHISDEFVKAASQFLSVPKLSIKVWAGKIDAMDLMHPPEALDKRLDEALKFIAVDPLLGCWMPESVRKMTTQEKFFVVLCFQQATGYELLEPLPSVSFVQNYLENLPGYEAEKSPA